MKKLNEDEAQLIEYKSSYNGDINVATEGYLSFDPDFDIEESGSSEKFFMFSVDIAEGNGGDDSVINIFEVEPMSDKEIEGYLSPGAMYDFFRINQIGIFRSNEHLLEDLF